MIFLLEIVAQIRALADQGLLFVILLQNNHIN